MTPHIIITAWAPAVAWGKAGKVTEADEGRREPVFRHQGHSLLHRAWNRRGMMPPDHPGQHSDPQHEQAQAPGPVPVRPSRADVPRGEKDARRGQAQPEEQWVVL